jgi:hypothetical protein
MNIPTNCAGYFTEFTDAKKNRLKDHLSRVVMGGL